MRAPSILPATAAPALIDNVGDGIPLFLNRTEGKSKEQIRAETDAITARNSRMVVQAPKAALGNGAPPDKLREELKAVRKEKARVPSEKLKAKKSGATAAMPLTGKAALAKIAQVAVENGEGEVTKAALDAGIPHINLNEAKTTDASDDGWTKLIATAWQKGVEAILETGRLLIEAREGPNKLPHGQFEAMVKLKLPFNERTAQRLMEIARHPVISNATHVSLLPPSWGTLYELTRVPNEILLTKIKDGSITPKTERRDVICMRPVPPKKSVSKKSTSIEKTAREALAPDEEIVLLRAFAKFVIYRTSSVGVDPKDSNEWSVLRGQVKAALP
jgi:hypothetical protein